MSSRELSLNTFHLGRNADRAVAFLFFSSGYVQTILSDSLLYASHAQSSSSTSVPNISLQDVILAIQSHLSHSMIQPPSKSTLLNLAGTLNSTPLPPISDRYGLRLPPREQCLTGVNFNIVPDPLDDDDDDDDEEEEDNENETVAGSAMAQRSTAPDAGNRRSEGVGEDEAEETLGAAMSRPGPEQADDSVGDTTMDTGDNGQRAGGAAEAQRGVKRSLEEDDEYD